MTSAPRAPFQKIHKKSLTAIVTTKSIRIRTPCVRKRTARSGQRAKMGKKSTPSEFSENVERSEVRFHCVLSVIRSAAAISSGVIEN
jgi:hypothetical protein